VTAAHDVVFVGGGFRTTSFLASAPQLLDRDVVVLEQGDRIGPGGFAEYLITTTSAGQRFLQHVRYEGPFAAMSTDARVRPVATSQAPVRMEHLADALGAVGDVITSSLPPGGARLRSRVVAVELDGDDTVNVALEDGGAVQARHVVLATGREERAHPSLAPWREKVVPSGAVIGRTGRPGLLAALERLDGADVVVAGCSHSGMSVLRALLGLRGLVRRIVVLQRSPARLTYPSVAAARAAHLPGREKQVDETTDVCPVSGMVFRDSGLRHESADLYRALWAGDLAGVELRRVGDVQDAADELDRAGVVVQALGYHGRAPDIREHGRVLRASDSPERLRHAADGAVLLHGRARATLSVLRTEPTPTDLRDHAAYGSTLYADLARRLDDAVVLA